MDTLTIASWVCFILMWGYGWTRDEDKKQKAITGVGETVCRSIRDLSSDQEKRHHALEGKLDLLVTSVKASALAQQTSPKTASFEAKALIDAVDSLSVVLQGVDMRMGSTGASPKGGLPTDEALLREVAEMSQAVWAIKAQLDHVLGGARVSARNEA